MTTNVYTSFANIVADIAVFCEFTSAGMLNEDTAVGMMEQLAFRLSDLNDTDKARLAARLVHLSFESSEKKNTDFVRGLPDSLGLI
ncbi:hypothetical protein [Massilia phyllosphaerae]|uniref:hypothetical protein n=1 Tax=Massilia phyllosphaerae TaxID=3106034 RepID=UPI002B1CD344|nr:hypothetical protein [Massilia sp. SGZ-792]